MHRVRAGAAGCSGHRLVGMQSLNLPQLAIKHQWYVTGRPDHSCFPGQQVDNFFHYSISTSRQNCNAVSMTLEWLLLGKKHFNGDPYHSTRGCFSQDSAHHSFCKGGHTFQSQRWCTPTKLLEWPSFRACTYLCLCCCSVSSARFDLNPRIPKSKQSLQLYPETPSHP